MKALVAILAALLVAAPAARAADQQIAASTSAAIFTPSSVTVGIGDTVTVSLGNGAVFSHNSHYFDEASGCPAFPTTSAWSCPRTFTSLGDYTFHCDLHQAMQATVHVVADPSAPGGGGKEPAPPSSGSGGGGGSPASPTGSVRKVSAGRLAALPSAGHCIDRAAFRLHLKRQAGETVVKGRVFVNGKRVATRGRGNLTAPLVLAKLPQGRVKVRIELTLEDGTRLVGSRRYSVCSEN